MNIELNRRNSAGSNRKHSTMIPVIFWAFVIGMSFGYIVGLWHQAAQKQYRIEIGLDDTTQTSQTYYERGQK